MTGALTTPSPDSASSSASQVFKSKSSATGSKNKTNVSQGENYLLIKTPDEGGHKRMLDVIFEKLRYTIESEWTEGQVVAEILESYEDVNVESPRRLTAAEKNDDLLVEIWKEEVKQHVTEVKALIRAKKKLFATVWKLLTKAMRNKVSAQEDFEEKNTAGDAVWLVNVIRAIVTDFDSTVPEILSTLDSLTKILTFQQSEKMENADYVKGLMALIKVHEQHCGPFGVSTKDMKRLYDQCDTAVDEQGQPLDADAKSRLRTKEAKVLRERAIAMQIIRGAYKRRYSALKKNLAMDYGLKINKYPDTVEDAINALNVQESNLPPHLRKGRNQNGFTLVQEGSERCVAGRNGRVIEHIQCHKCRAKGHYANQCPSNEDEGGDSSKATDSQEP